MLDRNDPAVRELVARYGPGAVVRCKGEPAWVVGYDLFADGPGLWLSRVNPAVDPEGGEKFAVCPECLAQGGEGHDHKERAAVGKKEADPAEADVSDSPPDTRPDEVPVPNPPPESE